MKAAYINRVGDAGEIQFGELPIPELHEDDVLIKVKAVSVNNVDTFVRSGGFKTNLTFPFVIGRDAVGEVLESGSQVTQFHAGQLVWTNSMGYDGRQGITSEFAAIPAERLNAVPDGVDPIQLIAAVHSAATAVILLQHHLQLESGQKVLVEGAAGHVGTKLIQVAHTMGARVLTTSNPNDFDNLKRLGSDKTLDYHGNWQTSASGVDVIVDTSGKVALQENVNLLALGGKIGMITTPADVNATFDSRSFYTSDKQLIGFVISHAELPQLQAAAKVLNDQFAQGNLLDDQVLVKPLSFAREAHELLQTGGVKEKLVLVPDGK